MKVIHFVCVCVVLSCLFALGQANPVPLVNQPLVPMTAVLGGPAFTLRVNGTDLCAELSSELEWQSARHHLRKPIAVNGNGSGV